MPNGTVKFFNAGKKFGFVAPDGGGKDIFVPIASVTAAGVPALIAGQRVSFEIAPDARGPKAVDLKLIAAAPVAAPPARKAPPNANGMDSTRRLTFYYDPASENATETLAVLRKRGFDPRLVDYVAAPPNVDELIRLSMHLPAGSLVRRYDRLFHDLRLDDRFIGQTEFWNGVFEHPTLINGPILATANRTCVCRSDDVMTDFLESVFPGHARPALEERILSERSVTPALEREAVKADAANGETIPPDLAVEPLVPPADLPADKATKAAPKKKSSGAKTAATRAAKKPVRKHAPARSKAK